MHPLFIKPNSFNSGSTQHDVNSIPLSIAISFTALMNDILSFEGTGRIPSRCAILSYILRNEKMHLLVYPFNLSEMCLNEFTW